MNFSILIPHFKNGKVTAHAIHKLLEFKGKHEIEIIIIDNNPNDNSSEYFSNYLASFGMSDHPIKYYEYSKYQIQSHGIAFDFALENGFVKNEWFITIESDSYPTNDKWLDYYENLINEGYDCAGSILKLSGGEYLHPCGALYNKSIWKAAKRYCDNINYHYFPNMSFKEGFNCHLMVYKGMSEAFYEHPEDYIEVSKGYMDLTTEEIMSKAKYYKPIVNPFHNGMGSNEESIRTYGERSHNTDVQYILLDNKKKLIHRIGYEPGQWFFYWQMAMKKKICAIPTEIKWIKGRENEQQEYTLMQNGFTHIWCGSSFLDMKGGDYNDVYEFKKNQIDELYNSLPEHKKIQVA